MSIFELTDPLFLPHHGCDVKLHVSRGDVLVLWGENGIGKTSLLQRFYRQCEAEAVMVDQKALDFFYDRTVSVMLDYFSDMQVSQFSHTRFSQLCDLFGFSQKRDRWLSQLSGGELQLLKLTLLLCAQKSFYLLDEPFQYLDHTRRLQLIHFLNCLSQEGATIVMVEHNQEGIPPDWQRLKLVVESQCLRVAP